MTTRMYIMKEEFEDGAKSGASELKAQLGTRLTLTNKFGSYSVVCFKEPMSLPDVMAKLVEPVLLAAGHHQDTIDEFFDT